MPAGHLHGHFGSQLLQLCLLVVLDRLLLCRYGYSASVCHAQLGCGGYPLTLGLGRCRQFVNGIGRGHISRLEHLLVQILLLQLLQLVVEFVVVDGVHLVADDGLDNLLAEGVLVPKFVPIARTVSLSPIPRTPTLLLASTYIVSSTFSGVSLPWISSMALPAFSMAASVSRLIFADSIE